MENKIVEGLKFHFTSEQVKAQLLARVEYHTKRAATKEAELPRLKESIENIKKVEAGTSMGNLSKGSNSYHMGDPVTALEADIKEHKNKAIVYSGMAEHIIPDVTYELTEADLQRLEILRRV